MTAVDEMENFGVDELFKDDEPALQEAVEDEKSDVPDTDAQEKKRSALKGVFDWFDSIVLSVIAVVLAFTFLFRVVGIVGNSMNNTLHNGDRVIIYNFMYEPKVGDIVVISRNASNDRADMESGKEPIIKRVIAVEGDLVDIKFEDGIGHVYVNGVLKNEGYIREYISESSPINDPISFPAFVPDGCIFVLGDNRNDSLDSRSGLIGEEGMIDTRYVLGKAVLRLFPLKDMRWL